MDALSLEVVGPWNLCDYYVATMYLLLSVWGGILLTDCVIYIYGVYVMYDYPKDSIDDSLKNPEDYGDLNACFIFDIINEVDEDIYFSIHGRPMLERNPFDRELPYILTGMPDPRKVEDLPLIW